MLREAGSLDGGMPILASGRYAHPTVRVWDRFSTPPVADDHTFGKLGQVGAAGQAPTPFNSSPPTAPAVKMTIHGRSTWALVDTGADFSMMRRGFYEDNQALKTTLLKPSVRTAVGAGGGSLQIAGELEDLPLFINGVVFRCPKMAVVDDLVYDVILGRDFSCAHRTIVDDDAGTFKIGGMNIPLPAKEQVRPRRARV